MPIQGAETNLVEVINISGDTVRFNIDGMIYVLSPMERAKINKSYTTLRQMQEKRDPVKSILELLTNSKVIPVTDARAAEFLHASP